MNYQSDCLCGGECQKPCVAYKQLQNEVAEVLKDTVVELNTMTQAELKYLEIHFADGEY
jgi:hypothetical protein